FVRRSKSASLLTSNLLKKQDLLISLMRLQGRSRQVGSSFWKIAWSSRKVRVCAFGGKRRATTEFGLSCSLQKMISEFVGRVRCDHA
ncbi:hypothetical protein, partial [Methylobacterium oxalidis]